MSKVFMLQGTSVRQVDSGFGVESKVPVGIYEVCMSMTGIWLERIADEFVFPYKIYGLQTDLMDHIIKTYDNTEGNMGVLLWGTKGSGKTVVAKQLCNRLQLPVIIIKNAEPAVLDYVSTLNTDCIIFLDEFEKNFKEEDGKILTLMDGVYNSGFRKIFLLTTNELRINENLLGRPSRIRYVKEFRNLELRAVEEYLDENLKDQSIREEVINYVDTLSISTIDILKTVVEEINIHGFENFKQYRKLFNVSTEEYLYYTDCAYVYEHNLISENEGKYTIDNFLEEIERRRKPVPYPNIKDEDNPTDAERKALAEYQASRTYHFSHYGFMDIVSEIKLTNLRKGSLFDDYPIVTIDFDRSVVVTYNAEDRRYMFYYISNPKATPSLYKTNNEKLSRVF